MSSLLVAVKSLLFLGLHSPQFVHLNRERGKAVAVNIVAMGTWKRGEAAAVTRSGHSGGEAVAITHNRQPFLNAILTKLR